MEVKPANMQTSHNLAFKVGQQSCCACFALSLSLSCLVKSMWFLHTEDQSTEKPKRRRKRKQDGEMKTSKAKKRRSSPCPDAEVTTQSRAASSVWVFPFC